MSLALLRISLVPALLLAAGVCGCKKSSAAEASLASAAEGDGPVDVPVPPADGPKLVALRSAAVVERPAAGARMLGELRAGGVVARSAKPYGRAGCDGGWYAVRPRGFVCAGDSASVDVASVRGLPAPPDLAHALPYRYGRARTEGVPLYATVPAPGDQLSSEPDVARYLASRGELDAEVLGTGANDVPVDARGVASGPPVLLPSGEGMAGTAKRVVGTYFQFASDLTPAAATASDAKGATLRKSSGVALTGSLVASGPSAPRRFGVLPDGRLVATDRLKPALGSSWHGIDVEQIGLPVAFVHKSGVNSWKLKKGKSEKVDDELERRSAVPLSGKFRTVEGVRFEQTREGAWLRAQDLIVIVRRSKFPEFATGKQKWLDISLANQTLTAYEGRKPIYATLVSSGRDQIGDPQTSASTVRGAFAVRSKHVTRAIDNREVGQTFDVADAPWVLEFEPGYALTGTYWSDSVGEAQGFHNVALTPVDARRIWTWADPVLPEGWHGVLDTGGGTTMVNVRP